MCKVVDVYEAVHVLCRAFEGRHDVKACYIEHRAMIAFEWAWCMHVNIIPECDFFNHVYD